MEDKIIASYMKNDGSVGKFLPHNQTDKNAHWDSGTGLTLSSEGREQFFPSHRILEINRFTQPKAYAWYSLKNDPVIDQLYDGDKSELKQLLLEISEGFDQAGFEELHDWLESNSEIETDAVIGSLVRITLSSELVEPVEEAEIPVSQRQELEA